MQLTDELVKEVQRSVKYAARGILGRGAVATDIDDHGMMYNGCDYLDEISQSMLLKILEDKGRRFEIAFEKGKIDFMNLVMRASRNLTKDYLRNAKEVPFSQLDAYDGDHEDTSEDDYN